MNYWNYFNERPGVSPAQLLILDDVHLAEGPLRDFFTVEIAAGAPLFDEVLRRIQQRFSYYGMVNHLLDGVVPLSPTEMITPLDVLDIADDLRPLLDAQLVEGSEAWWSWRRIRGRAERCCWLISPRAVTITPWIPPSQTIEHFSAPQRRLYMSATVGHPEDLRRRIGCGPVVKVTSVAAPRQGQRWIAFSASAREQEPEEVAPELRPLLQKERKALWLCARRATATRLETELPTLGL